MISEDDKTRIQDIAKQYKVKKIIFFGSGCDPSKESNDIDLAVEGIPHSQFFKFYSDLIFSLSKLVDIIDLTKNSRFNKIIATE
jgi:predicted nucleotidyltransferase